VVREIQASEVQSRRDAGGAGNCDRALCRIDILPNEAAIRRLVGAIVFELNDGALETIALIDGIVVNLPALAGATRPRR
jgi:hypothetical protein